MLWILSTLPWNIKQKAPTVAGDPATRDKYRGDLPLAA
jgi:hypothetical protein